MKLKVYNSMKLEKTTTYEVKEIIGLDDDCSEEERQMIRNGECRPMLNIVTECGRSISIPIEFLIKITE